MWSTLTITVAFRCWPIELKRQNSSQFGEIYNLSQLLRKKCRGKLFLSSIFITETQTDRYTNVHSRSDVNSYNSFSFPMHVTDSRGKTPRIKSHFYAQLLYFSKIH